MAKAHDTSKLKSAGNSDSGTEVLAVLAQLQQDHAEILDYPLRSLLFPVLFQPVEQIYRFLKKQDCCEPCIPCTKKNRILILRVSEIVFVSSTSSGNLVTDIDGEVYCTDWSLARIEKRTAFFRCHRQFLVNLKEISEICLISGQAAEIKTRLGLSVPLSRRGWMSLKGKLAI